MLFNNCGLKLMQTGVLVARIHVEVHGTLQHRPYSQKIENHILRSYIFLP